MINSSKIITKFYITAHTDSLLHHYNPLGHYLALEEGTVQDIVQGTAQGTGLVGIALEDIVPEDYKAVAHKEDILNAPQERTLQRLFSQINF